MSLGQPRSPQGPGAARVSVKSPHFSQSHGDRGSTPPRRSPSTDGDAEAQGNCGGGDGAGAGSAAAATGTGGYDDVVTQRRHEQTAALRKANRLSAVGRAREIKLQLHRKEEATTGGEQAGPGGGAAALDYGRRPTVQDLPKLAQICFSSGDSAACLKAVIQIRLLVSEENPPINDVICSGVVQKLALFVAQPNEPLLQYEAAWAISNIATGNHEVIKYLVQLGIVPLFISLISASDTRLREQVLWGLGNIVLDSVEARDLVISLGIVTPLVTIVTSDCESVVRIAVWILSNLLRGDPSPPLPVVFPVLKSLLDLLQHQDNNVVCDALWGLCHGASGDDPLKQGICDLGFCYLVAPVLMIDDPLMQSPALATLKLLAGNPKYTQIVIDSGVLPVVAQLLSQPTTTKPVKQAACSLFACITKAGSSCVEALITQGYMETVIGYLSSSEACLAIEACYAICNALCCNGTQDHISYLVSQDIFPGMCNLLTRTDVRLVLSILQGFEVALRFGNCTMSGGGNMFTELATCAGLPDMLFMLSNSKNTAISTLATHLIDTFFAEEAAFAEAEDEMLGTGQQHQHQHPHPSLCLTHHSNTSSLAPETLGRLRHTSHTAMSVKHGVGDVSAEYSASDRSKCKKCWKPIGPGDLRFGVWEQSNDFDGLIVRWYHPTCYFRKFKGSSDCVKHSSRVLGFADLRWADQMMITKELGETRDVAPGEEEANNLRWRIRDELESHGIALTRSILKHNEQPTTGATKHLIQRVVEGMLYGALPKCTACKEGDIYWDSDLNKYKCSGDLSEWARCTWESEGFESVERVPWSMPGNTGSKFLDSWVPPKTKPPIPRRAVETKTEAKPQTTVLTTKCPPQSKIETAVPVQQAPSKKLPEEPQIELPAILKPLPRTSPKPGKELDGLTFAISGKLSRNQANTKTWIESHGGRVTSQLSGKTHLLLSTEAYVTKRGSKACQAEQLRVPIVSEQFVKDCIAKCTIVDVFPCLLTKKSFNTQVQVPTQISPPLQQPLSSMLPPPITQPAVTPLEVKSPVREQHTHTFTSPKTISTSLPVEYIVDKRTEMSLSTFQLPLSQNLFEVPKKVDKDMCLSDFLNAGPPLVDQSIYAPIYLPPKNLIPEKIIGWNRWDTPAGPAALIAATDSAQAVMPTSPSSPSKAIVDPVALAKRAVNPDSGLSASHHLYSEKGCLFNMVLSNADITSQQNSYYFCQILEPDSGKGSGFVVWMKWGRVGTGIGKDKSEVFKNSKSAVEFFCDKFLDKTGNHWDDRDNFQKKPRGYFPIDVDLEEHTTQVKESAANLPESSLEPRVFRLVQLLFDADRMESTMQGLGVDTSKMPLGKLTKRHILSGYQVLKEIEIILASNIPNKEGRFLETSNRFYTLIPHSFPSGQVPPLINNTRLLIQKMSMLEALADIEIASSLLRDDSTTSSNLNPVDLQFRKLKTSIEALEQGTPEFELLQKYVNNTTSKSSDFTLSIENAFRVSRMGEDERYAFHRTRQNRMLLWHGSRLTNYAGILSQGLRIAPPEAPITGYMFGKGIYFGDMASKSAEYCKATPENPFGILLLCEVSLGNSLVLTRAKYIEPSELQLSGHHSTKALGAREPDPAVKHLTEDSVIVPLGSEVPTGAVDPELPNNEYIVYDATQVAQRYLLQVKFHFKDSAHFVAKDLSYPLPPQRKV
ncbi:hypothetical protein Pelo_11594 [Pelomyxa schiedti]|nr:hypothetical protein Pelo_11594 [Pelomyxa schiedti]